MGVGRPFGDRRTGRERRLPLPAGTRNPDVEKASLLGVPFEEWTAARSIGKVRTIQVAVDLLVLKRPITQGETNRFLIHRALGPGRR